MKSIAWLGDEHVRKGIKSLLELDRCMEERNRLISECISMRQWLCEEWVVVTSAITLIGWMNNRP